MSSHINPDSGQLVIESTNVFDVSTTPVNPVGASLYIKGGVYTETDMYIHGTLVVNGNVISLGNAGGSLTFNANISSDVIPNISSGIQYDLGSNTNPWNEGYFQKIVTKPEVSTTAIPTTTGTTYLDGTTSTSLALANGIEGERKAIVVTATPAGAITVTPDTAVGYTSMQFTAVGDSAELMYTSTGWSILSVFRTSVT
jgi:hypothetical protein